MLEISIFFLFLRFYYLRVRPDRRTADWAALLYLLGTARRLTLYFTGRWKPAYGLKVAVYSNLNWLHFHVTFYILGSKGAADLKLGRHPDPGSETKVCVVILSFWASH